nr:MAG TPA: hypothetical protein [Caudoviricetes sp.]
MAGNTPSSRTSTISSADRKPLRFNRSIYIQQSEVKRFGMR